MAMLTWIMMRERRKFFMLDRQETFEVEVGEEDGIAMVRVSGEEGLDDNPIAYQQGAQQWNPFAPKCARFLTNSTRLFNINLYGDALRPATRRPSCESGNEVL